MFDSQYAGGTGGEVKDAFPFIRVAVLDGYSSAMMRRREQTWWTGLSTVCDWMRSAAGG